MTTSRALPSPHTIETDNVINDILLKSRPPTSTWGLCLYNTAVVVTSISGLVVGVVIVLAWFYSENADGLGVGFDWAFGVYSLGLALFAWVRESGPTHDSRVGKQLAAYLTALAWAGISLTVVSALARAVLPLAESRGYGWIIQIGQPPSWMQVIAILTTSLGCLGLAGSLVPERSPDRNKRRAAPNAKQAVATRQNMSPSPPAPRKQRPSKTFGKNKRKH